MNDVLVLEIHNGVAVHPVRDGWLANRAQALLRFAILLQNPIHGHTPGRSGYRGVRCYGIHKQCIAHGITACERRAKRSQEEKTDALHDY